MAWLVSRFRSTLTAEIYDAFRRVDGSYTRNAECCALGARSRPPVRINTTITRHNPGPARRRDRTSGRLDIVLWSVFFLVPTGRGQATDLISTEEFEQVFEKLHSTS